MGKEWEIKKKLPNSENQLVINEFLFSLKNRNKSISTIIKYRCVLQAFFKDKDILFSDLTSEEIEKSFMAQEKVGRKKGTQQEYFKVLRYFYKFCKEENKIKIMPVKEKSSPYTYWVVKVPIANDTNEKVINEFLKSVKEDKSKQDTLNFRKNLQTYFAEREEKYSSITSKDFKRWLLIYQKGRKKETITNFLASLQTFYLFCIKKGYIENSPIPEGGVPYWELKLQLPNDENQKVINEFLLSLKFKNKRESTIIRYREKLQIFFKNKENPYSSHTPEDTKKAIKDYSKRINNHTISSYLFYLRGFYHFCVEKGYMDLNPIEYQRPKEEKYWVIKRTLPNKENEKIINEYLLSIYVENYSKWTIKAYRDTLQSFFKDKKELYSSISSEKIRQWLLHLEERCKEGTITYKLNALNSFYRFCIEDGLLEKSPIKKRWFPRLPHPVPKFLNKGEIALIRKQSDSELIRNRLLVEFLLSSGCRVGEVHALNRSDVDVENRTAMVTGKGKKIRQVHFSVRCAMLLERYLQLRNDKDPALFVTIHMNPRRLSAKWIRAILNGIGIRAGLSKSLHPHRLRHTFATELLEKGAELSFIGDELGHSRLKTTQIYANLPNEKIKVLYRQYMG